MDRLKESPNGRVINVSDMLHNIGNIDFQDLKFEKNYSIYSAFARSKLAQVMFNRQLAVEALGTNVTTYAMSTSILRYRKNYPDNDWRHHFNDWLTKMSDPLNGIQTILYLSLKEELRNESGFYYRF
jgi:hypothetical protein